MVNYKYNLNRARACGGDTMKQKQTVLAIVTLMLIAVLTISALVGCDEQTAFVITFDPANGGNTTEVTVTSGELPNRPEDPTREGYTFLGWYLGETAYDFTAPVTGDLTLAARWEAKTYRVTFDANGGEDVSPATAAHGDTVVAPEAPTREGYTFLGWYLEETAYDFSAPVTGDLTLAARWEAKTYRLNFDANGGEDVSPATAAHGDTVVAPEAPTREGYTFLGWYLGETAYDFTAPVTGDLTLAARWAVKTYRVNFDANGGEDVSPATVAHGDTVAAPEAPTREGYTFLGWYLGETAYDFTAPVTGDLTLTARWQIKTYTVTFLGADGTVLKTETVEWGKAATAPEPPEAEEGFVFAGWNRAFDRVAENLTVTATYGKKTSVTFVNEANETLKIIYVAEGGTFTVPDLPAPEEKYTLDGFYLDGVRYDFTQVVTGDLTIVVKWRIKTFTVTIDPANGGNTTEVTRQWGETVAAPEAPTREGYTFLGWYLEETAYDFSAPVTGDLTLTAHWQIKTFTVSFDPAGGDARDPQTVEWNAAATKPQDPMRAYYRFGGWLLNGEAYDFSTPVTGDLTLTAKWITIYYTVIFDSNGGSTVPDVLATAGKPIAKPQDPIKTGYRFGGWLTADGKVWDFGTAITETMTLTAQWFDKTTAPEATVTGITLDPGELEMWKGMSLKLAMSPMAVSDTDGAFTKLTAAGITLRFVSLDPDVATVAPDGTVTSVSLGETLIYAVFETGGTINNGTADVTVTAGDISNAVTVRVVDKPDYLKAYERDPEKQQITLGNVTGKDVTKYNTYPTGDYGAANIATWYGNANTVFTLTADDNLMGDFAQWLAWYEAYGVTTTLCAPTPTYYECNDLWNQMVNSGLYVQSHSHYHRSTNDYKYTSTAQDWMDFYLGAQEMGATGIRSLIIAYPCGHNNSALSQLLYIGGRGTGGYLNKFDVNYNETASFSGLNENQFAQLISAIGAGNGTWVSSHYHQIGSNTGSLNAMLSQLAPYIKEGKLWSATFAAACQYGQERDTATLTMGNVGRDAITFTLTDRMNDLLFDQALTIKIKVDGTWRAARAYQNGQEMPAKVVTEGGNTYLFVDAVPDRGEVTVVRTELSGLTEGEDRIAFTPVEAGDGYENKVMTRRFFVTGDAWKNAYAVQGGQHIMAAVGSVGGDRYVDVTFDVGGGEVILVPTTSEFAASATYSMTDVYYGAVTPVSGKTVTISTAEELRLFARYVNNDNSTEGLTFVLTEDIDLAGVTMEPIGWFVQCNKSSTLRFDRSFRGIFDGQGHTVSNLTIRHNGCSTGFFGSVSGGTVKNVKLTDASVFGMRQTGGIVGRLVQGTVENCSFRGTVTSYGVRGDTNSGNSVGGLVGEMLHATVRNCAVEAEVLVPYMAGANIGGAIGKISGVQNGSVFSQVQNVSFYGKVTATSDRDGGATAVGGFIGGTGDNYSGANVIDCSATAEVRGGMKVGGFIGSHYCGNQDIKIRNCVANGSVYGSDQVGGFAGFMGSTGRAGTTNSFANVRVSAAEGAEYVAAVIGQLNSNNAKKIYYIPSLNGEMAACNGTSANVVEVTDVTAALTALNALAAAAKDQTWILSGDTITPVHYPIFRVVFLDKDGGALAAYDVPNGMGVEAPATPRYIGYRFTGWSASTDNVTGDMTVRALYEAVETHTVIFLDKDGNELSRTTVNDGESVTPPSAPAYEGYRFTGWSEKIDAVTGDMTVKAQYESVNVWTVIFAERDGETAIGAAQRINDGEAATAPEAPAVEGYVFTGWSVDFSAVHGNLTVVAQYARLWAVRFFGNDGVLLSTQTVQDGKAAKAPGAPAVDGYRFTGWIEDFSNVTSDLDVHANYVVKSTDPITVEIKHVTTGYTDVIGGDILFSDNNKIGSVPDGVWGIEKETSLRGSATGSGYAIIYNLSRYTLAPGMAPLTIVTTQYAQNRKNLKQEYCIFKDELSLDTQAFAVPLFDQESQRVIVAVLIYYGANNSTSEAEFTKNLRAIMTECVAFYPEADAFVASMHVKSKGPDSGHKEVLSGLDDTTPIVTGWNLDCLSEMTQVDGNSSFYTLVYTKTGESGSVTVTPAQVPKQANVSDGGYTVTVRVGKKDQ